QGPAGDFPVHYGTGKNDTEPDYRQLRPSPAYADNRRQTSAQCRAATVHHGEKLIFCRLTLCRSWKSSVDLLSLWLLAQCFFSAALACHHSVLSLFHSWRSRRCCLVLNTVLAAALPSSVWPPCFFLFSRPRSWLSFMVCSLRWLVCYWGCS